MKTLGSINLHRWLVLPLGSLCINEPAAASQEKEEIVVLATRSQTNKEDSPRTLSTVTSEKLSERPGANGIQSLLAEIPGIQFVRSGGLGGQIMMRGFNSNDGRSILAIDGDRYRGRSTLQFNMLDPSAIERIEVIRGPASALYGSDAMTGVINVITRRAAIDTDRPFSLQPRLRAVGWNSGNNLYQGRAELEGGGDGVDVMVGAGYSHADDYYTPLGDAINSGSQGKSLDFNIGYRPGNTSRWELSGRWQNVRTGRAGGLGGAPGYPLTQVNESPVTERYLRLGYEEEQPLWLADSFDTTLYVRDFKTDIYQQNATNPNTLAYSHMKVYSPTVWGGHFTAQKQLDNHQISYGGDFYYEDFQGRRNNTTLVAKKTGNTVKDSGWFTMERDTSTTNVGLFVNDSWTLNEQWIVTGALRGDAVLSRIGSPLAREQASQRDAFAGKTKNTDYALTGSLGAVYKLTPQWHLVGNVSRGFRAPSGSNRVMTSVAGTITTLPAPDLTAETNISAEAGIRWYGQQSSLNLTAWQSKYDDMIGLVAVAPGVRQRQNINSATLRGVELQGNIWFNADWSSRYTLAFTRADDDTRHRPLPYISPLTASLSLRYDQHYGYAEGIVRAVADKHRIDPTLERKTPGYALVDLYSGLYLDALFGESYAQWKLVAGVENLFNKTARNPVVNEDIRYSNQLIGNPLVEPGRSFVVKLTVDY